MQTFLNVLKVEVLRNLRLARWWVFTPLILGLALLSAVSFIQFYRLQQEEFRRAKEELENMLAMLEEANELRGINFEVVKKTGMNLYLDYAQARRIPDSAIFNLIDEKPTLWFTRQSDSFQVLPRYIDWAFLVRYCLGVIALLLAHDSISSELTSGVLKLSLATPISRASYLLGKLGGIFICVLIPLAAAFLLFLSFAGAAGHSFSVLDFKTLSGGVLATTLLLLFLLLIGLWISIVSRSSSKALIWVLIFWTAGVFFIPSFARMGGMLTTRPESYSEYEQRLQETRFKLLRGKIDETTIENLRQSLRTLRQDRQERLYGQVATAWKLARFSPFILHDQALSILAESGQQSHLRFMQNLEEYIERLQRMASQQNQTGGIESLRESAIFVQQETPAEVRIGNALLVMSPLLPVSALLFFAAFVSFARLEV